MKKAKLFHKTEGPLHWLGAISKGSGEVMTLPSHTAPLSTIHGQGILSASERLPNSIRQWLLILQKIRMGEVPVTNLQLSKDRLLHHAPDTRALKIVVSFKAIAMLLEWAAMHTGYGLRGWLDSDAVFITH